MTTFGIASATMTARARWCDRCRNLRIDPGTVLLNEKGADPYRAADDTCPACGNVDRFVTGAFFGTLTFFADGEQPTLLRRFFAYWIRGTGAKVRAAACRNCGWIGIDPHTLVETTPQPLADRLE